MVISSIMITASESHYLERAVLNADAQVFDFRGEQELVEVF